MRVLHSLVLLLALIAPPAFADGAFQVEMILFRQQGEPAATRQFAPEDWAAGAQRIQATSERSIALKDLADKLDGSGRYQVLLHRAWQQDLGAEPGKVAISNGPQQLGHFPVEGTLSIAIARFTDIAADFWVNQLDDHGVLTSSERMKQNTRVKNGALIYMDHGSLAMLIKVSPL
jgi:hypothetical protein